MVNSVTTARCRSQTGWTLLIVVCLSATRQVFAVSANAAKDGHKVWSPRTMVRVSRWPGRQLRQSDGDGAAGCEPGFYLPTSGCQLCTNRLPANSYGVCPATGSNQRSATASAGIQGPDQRPFLHGLFSNRAVLARNRRGNVFGYATSGTKVTVSIRRQSTNTLIKQRVVYADSNGRWQASFGLLGNQMVYSGPFTLTASRSGYSIKRQDILVGEVWLVAGQSNMVYALGDVVSGSATFKARAQAELNDANDDKIRTFLVPRNYSSTPLQNVLGSWNATSSGTIDRFSAIGYLLATNLRSKLNVPIGIVEAAVGATSIVDWLPPATVEALGGVAAQQADPKENYWNAMINNLGKDFGGYDFSGTVWYQGESDGGLTSQNKLYSMYTTLLKSLLSTWRSTLGYSKMPFVIVQLANYIPRYNSGDEPFVSNVNHWPFVRESQRQVALTDGNAYLATAFDLGNNHVIHPPDKWDVANRVVRAFSKVYGFTEQVSGPTIAGVTRGTNGHLTLSFDNISSGLRLAFKDNTTVYTTRTVYGTHVQCFQLQNSKDVWRNATAILQSDKKTLSVGPLPGVSAPKGVRYAWLDGQPTGGCDLYNTASLPAIPFTQAVPP